MVELYFFASYRQVLGFKALTLVWVEGSSIRDIAHTIELTYSLSLKGALCALNENYVHPDAKVQQGDRLAFFPPVAGG